MDTVYNYMETLSQDICAETHSYPVQKGWKPEDSNYVA